MPTAVPALPPALVCFFPLDSQEQEQLTNNWNFLNTADSSTFGTTNKERIIEIGNIFLRFFFRQAEKREIFLINAAYRNRAKDEDRAIDEARARNGARDKEEGYKARAIDEASARDQARAVAMIEARPKIQDCAREMLRNLLRQIGSPSLEIVGLLSYENQIRILRIGSVWRENIPVSRPTTPSTTSRGSSTPPPISMPVPKSRARN
ncbi:hypothetical protein JYU14_01315 [Simkania negevensis]|uniref:Band 7 domain-containing protein n=1 Tax=Simkania negevensis TaxID=83561 RepID=A0ABS3AT57_9BACT|nr:hypothetical protein [Simkania negevensis]